MDANETDPTPTIAQTVRTRREQLGITQVAAAEDAGVSRRLWSEIELGRRRGSDETLAAIETVLDIHPGTLSALEVQIGSRDLAAMRRELIDMVNELTTRQQLEDARLDMIRRRFAAVKAQLEYEEAKRAAHETRPSRTQRRKQR